VEKFYKLLRTIIPDDFEIILQDERYTTIKATGMMKYGAGLKSSQIKKIKDKMSAVVILQEYMERI
jgi:putative Holliday junction resolvase